MTRTVLARVEKGSMVQDTKQNCALLNGGRVEKRLEGKLCIWGGSASHSLESNLGLRKHPLVSCIGLSRAIGNHSHLVSCPCAGENALYYGGHYQIRMPKHHRHNSFLGIGFKYFADARCP